MGGGFVVVLLAGFSWLLVTDGPVNAAYPGQNGLIAFDSRRVDSGDIFVMAPDGSGQVNITSNPGRDTSPKWSPDGTRIAFMSQRTGVNEIYTMNADGSGLVQVTNTPGLSEDNPTWSPDGSQLAVIVHDGVSVSREIWVMEADGSLPHRVAAGLGTIQELAWSPDGSRFAYQLLTEPADWNIFTVNVDGTGIRQLTTTPGHDVAPDWSPDGSRIVFGSYRHGDPEIYTISANGQNETRLTFNGAGDLPRWSPDGTRITFTSRRTGGPEIFVMAADGSHQTRLTFANGFDFRSDWQPISAPGGRFVDDNGNEHEPNIEAIAAAGITQGCNPPASDRYCPGDPVTRAQMAVFLARAVGETGNLPVYQGLFSDVPAGLWYTGHAERLYQLGITTGCAVNPLRYCPTDTVTRAQMAAFILRAIGEDANLPAYQGYLSDVSAGIWYTGYVERLFQLGITTGCSPGKYCPGNPVKRDQMASFLARALGLTPIVPPPPTTTTTLAPGDFAPFVLSGTGDDVRPLAIPKDDRAVLAISYTGSGNFIIWSYGTGDKVLNLVVNNIGPYSGRRPVNVDANDPPVRYIEVTAGGSWTIEVLPVSLASTQLSGTGDSFIRVVPKPFNRPLTITHTGSSNFIVWSYSASDVLDLEVNEIGPYSGTVLLDAGAEFLEIRADGAWTISFG